jgi:hypothetical protein
VNEDCKVIDVSCQGHIVITRTWHGDEREGTSTFTDKDGNTLERMNWKDTRLEFSSPREPGDTRSLEEYIETSSKQYHTFTYREIFLYHYERAQESIPIYPLAEKTCHCCCYDSIVEAVQFFKDGRLLAYHYKDSIFVVKTSDGSLYKRCSFAANVMLTQVSDIVLVSECYVIMCYIRFLFVINVQTNEIKHRICLPHFILPKNLSVLPKQVGQPFTLRVKHITPFIDVHVSHLVFHNLEF